MFPFVSVHSSLLQNLFKYIPVFCSNSYIKRKHQTIIDRKIRGSHQRCSVKKGVLKNFTNFTGKHVLESLFNKVAGLKAYNFLKNRLQHRCFPVKSLKFFRATILKNICKRLLLKNVKS